MNLSFREEPPFSREREHLFGNDKSFALFQSELSEHPQSMPVIPGTGKARKIRWGHPRRGKGKRGGIRIIYAYYEKYETILLLFGYDKNIPDLTPAQKKGIAQTITEFEQQLEEEFLPNS